MEEFHSGRLTRSIRFPRLGCHWDSYKNLGISDLDILHFKLKAQRKQFGSELISKSEAVAEGTTRRMETEIRDLISQYVDFRERETVVWAILELLSIQPDRLVPSWEKYSHKGSDWNSLHADASQNSFTLERMIAFIELAENDFGRNPYRHEEEKGLKRPIEGEIQLNLPKGKRDKQAHRKQELVDKFWILVDDGKRPSHAKDDILDEMTAMFPERCHISKRQLERYISEMPRS